MSDYDKGCNGELPVAPSRVELAAIQSRDATSATTWYEGPTSPKSQCFRDRRALLAVVDSQAVQITDLEQDDRRWQNARDAWQESDKRKDDKVAELERANAELKASNDLLLAAIGNAHITALGQEPEPAAAGTLLLSTRTINLSSVFGDSKRSVKLGLPADPMRDGYWWSFTNDGVVTTIRLSGDAMDAVVSLFAVAIREQIRSEYDDLEKAWELVKSINSVAPKDTSQ